MIKPIKKKNRNTCNNCFWFFQVHMDMAWKYKSLCLKSLNLDANFVCYTIQRSVKFCLVLIK